MTKHMKYLVKIAKAENGLFVAIGRIAKALKVSDDKDIRDTLSLTKQHLEAELRIIKKLYCTKCREYGIYDKEVMQNMHMPAVID